MVLESVNTAEIVELLSYFPVVGLNGYRTL